MKMSTTKKNIIYNSLYQVLVIVIPLVTTPYISRILGAKGIGIYSYNYSIAQYYVLFIMLGLNNYGNRTIAEVRGEKEKLTQTFWSIYFLQFILGIIVCTVYIIYCLSISKNMEISLIMALYVISACFDINWFFFGMEKFKLTVTRNFIIKILTTASIFIFVKSENDLWKYCFILTFGMLISQIALWPTLHKYIYFYKPNFNEICKHIKPNCILFLTVLAVSLYKIMDKIMLGILSTKEQVGFYESSERIITVPTAFITSIGTVMLPRMSNMMSNNDKKTNVVLYKSILLAIFLSSSMGFGIMGVAKEFVPLFYGKGYETCVSLFWILLPSSIFFAFGNVIRTQYLLPKKMDKVYVTSAFLGALTNVIINLLLIPRYYSIGAAIGTLFSEAIVCIYQSKKIEGCIPIKKYVKKIFPFILAGIGMYIILINLNLKTELLESLILKIIIGAIIYVLILIWSAVFYMKIYKKHIFEL